MIDVYSKVLKLLSADNLKRAEIISRRSLKKYNDDRFYYLLAIIYFKRKIYKKSLININYFLRNSVVNKDGLILKIHVLIRLQSYGEALEILKKIKDMDNRKSDINMMIGHCYLKINNKTLARRYFRNSINYENSKRNIINIFNIYFQENLLIESILVLRKYKEFKSDLELLLKYCQILLDLGKIKKALIQLDSVKLKFQNDINFLNQIALTNLSYGNIEEARDNFKKVISISPYNGLANNYLARIGYEFKEVEIKKLEEHLNKHKCDFNLMYIGSSLNNYFKIKKKFEKSVYYLNYSNEFYRKHLIRNFSWDISRESCTFNYVKRIYENISNNKIEFIPDQRIRPIFIVGLPRSGTTLIESIICQSNKVRRFGELPDFNIAFKKYFLERIKKKSDINYIESDSANKVINSYSNKFKSIDSYFTDKLPLNFMYIGLLEKFFPKSKIILCQRDKNDNLLSIYETFFTDNNYAFSYSTEDLKQYYMLYIEQINFWKKNKAKFCEIKYEDLVRNSESSIKNICNFLDLTYTNELLDFHNKKNSVLTASNYQVRQKIYQNSVGKFNYYKDLLNFE